jgi:hypothetical protein
MRVNIPNNLRHNGMSVKSATVILEIREDSFLE